MLTITRFPKKKKPGPYRKSTFVPRRLLWRSGPICPEILKRDPARTQTYIAEIRPILWRGTLKMVVLNHRYLKTNQDRQDHVTHPSSCGGWGGGIPDVTGASPMSVSSAICPNYINDICYDTAAIAANQRHAIYSQSTARQTWKYQIN